MRNERVESRVLLGAEPDEDLARNWPWEKSVESLEAHLHLRLHHAPFGEDPDQVLQGCARLGHLRERFLLIRYVLGQARQEPRALAPHRLKLAPAGDLLGAQTRELRLLQLQVVKGPAPLRG